MATTTPTSGSSPNSSLILPPSGIADVPDAGTFSKKRAAVKLAAWVQESYDAAKTDRSSKQVDWQTNLSYFYGRQWVKRGVGKYANSLITPQNSKTPERKIINRIRAQVRSELSRFMSSEPNIVAVPASAEDQDVRAAFAAQAVVNYLEYAGKISTHLADAYFWMILTGNGFIKTWWDDDKIDLSSQQAGSVCFASVKPFNLFVPDQRERNIQDQPYVIFATVRPTYWCEQVFKDALDGRKLEPSVSSNTAINPDGAMNIQTSSSRKDSCIVFETWVKPGATPMMPNGGLIVTIDQTVVAYYDGNPYDHGQYPVTKFEHILSGGFYADSPLSDTRSLQKEYNKLRSDVSHAGTTMAMPQIMAPVGSIVPSKLTNLPAQVVEYQLGGPPPQPLPKAELPNYYLGQQETILADWEDLSGQHDVSKGQAPAGVTAGTAINYLQERDNQFLTPEYISIEDGKEDIDRMSLGLFQQYVDVKRKIQIVGADQAYDILMLQGSDITRGTDVRVERGSAVNESKAARDAKYMDLWNSGVITDPSQLLHLMEIGGPQRILDIFDAAEAKAHRENTKIKLMKPADIQAYRAQEQQAQQDFQMQQAQQQMMSQVQQILVGAADPSQQALGAPSPDPSGIPQQPQQPDTSMLNPLSTADPNAETQGDPMQPPGMIGPEPLGPIIPVDDFDVHEKHMLVHNTFRMSQEYEMLDPLQKEEMDKHVKGHMWALQRQQIQQFTGMIPSDGTDPNAPQPQDMSVDTGAPAPPDGSVGANGVAPAPVQSQQ